MSDLSELKESDWYKERPQIIKDAIEILSPATHCMFKNSGKQCYIISYSEPKSNKLEDVTVTVQKTGIGGAMDSMGLGELDKQQVFGVPLNTLEEWKD